MAGLARTFAGVGSILALAACAPEPGPNNETPDSFTGYELASDQDAGAGATSDSLVLGIAPRELVAILDQGDIRLIDVRTPEEFTEGHIEGAELIPLDTFDPAKLDPADKRAIVLYCRSGRRSAIAAKQLASHTGEPVPHLEGGILAWYEYHAKAE